MNKSRRLYSKQKTRPPLGPRSISSLTSSKVIKSLISRENDKRRSSIKFLATYVASVVKDFSSRIEINNKEISSKDFGMFLQEFTIGGL